MEEPRPLTAAMALLCGGCAAVISASWLWMSWDGGIKFPPPPPEDLMDFGSLQATAGLAVAFQFGVPLLVIAALASGLPASRHRAAQIGLFLAAASGACYLLFMRARTNLIYEASNGV